jgi:transposase
MYFVGIDVSKYKHDCFIVTEEGVVIKDTFSFDNNRTGFTLFFNTLSSLGPPNKIRIGLEATGHYGNNLMKHLSVKGYSFVLLNPIIVSRFRSSETLRRTKTDKLDAMLIAEVIASRDFKNYPLLAYHFSDLKSLTRLRDRYVKQRSLYLVHLTNQLDVVFPEFKPFFGDSLQSKTAIYILTKYTLPKRIANLNMLSYDALRKLSRGKFTYPKFVKLKKLARNTVGSSSEIDGLTINSILRLYNLIEEEINTVEAKIEAIMLALDPPTMSIPGIGLMSAAAIVAEYGDINRFSSDAKMLAYAGLDAAHYQSGLANHKGRMVKHGSSYLRQALMNVAFSTLKYIPSLYDYYHRKKDVEGKHHRVALSHVARKLIRLIYKLETSRTRFDLSLYNSHK